MCLCPRCENQVARFELTIDIESLLDEADSDHSGFIDFDVSRQLCNHSLLVVGRLCAMQALCVCVHACVRACVQRAFTCQQASFSKTGAPEGAAH